MAGTASGASRQGRFILRRPKYQGGRGSCRASLFLQAHRADIVKPRASARGTRGDALYNNPTCSPSPTGATSFRAETRPRPDHKMSPLWGAPIAEYPVDSAFPRARALGFMRSALRACKESMPTFVLAPWALRGPPYGLVLHSGRRPAASGRRGKTPARRFSETGRTSPRGPRRSCR